MIGIKLADGLLTVRFSIQYPSLNIFTIWGTISGVKILLILLITIIGSALLGLLGWWLLITTEGVYLGRRMVIWLYDVYASRYDRIKAYQPLYENYYLAKPIMQAVAPNEAPLVLDVATGTCRLPGALARHRHFQGMVIGVDLSRQMLSHGVHRIAKEMYHNRAYLMHCPAERLPFPDNTFDVVTCLEALEFMVRPRAAIREIVRVTRPGGLILLTNRRGRDAKLMPGKAWSPEKAQQIYQEEFGLQDLRIDQWQIDYDLVWARKTGESLPSRPRPLGEIWRCPRCDQIQMIAGENSWMCEHCQQRVAVGKDGIIELMRAL